MGDLISRQAAIEALIKADYEFTGILSEPRARRFEQTINALPSAQPDIKDLIEEIKNGITVSDGNSDYFIGLRNGMRWCLSLIDDKEPIYESSAQPERKTGKWEIYIISMFDGEGCRCSECGFEGVPYWDFCPNCGADMRGEQDEGD